MRNTVVSVQGLGEILRRNFSQELTVRSIFIYKLNGQRVLSREFKPSFNAKIRIAWKVRAEKCQNYAKEQVQKDELCARLET